VGGKLDGRVAGDGWLVQSVGRRLGIGVPAENQGVKRVVSVQNLTNKTYVSQCASDLDCYYGEGRTVVSSLTYDW